jgi:hypothetical protein
VDFVSRARYLAEKTAQQLLHMPVGADEERLRGGVDGTEPGERGVGGTEFVGET